MQHKLVKIFLQLEAGAFGDNIGNKPQKPRPKLFAYLLCNLM